MNKRASIDYGKVITIWLISPPAYGHKINRRDQKFTWQRESKGKRNHVGFPREPGGDVLFMVLLTRPDKCSLCIILVAPLSSGWFPVTKSAVYCMYNNEKIHFTMMDRAPHAC